MHHALDTRYIEYLYTYISTQKAATVFSTYYVGTYYTRGRLFWVILKSMRQNDL